MNRTISKELNAFLLDFCGDKPEYAGIKDYYCKKNTHLNGMQFFAGFKAGNGKRWQRYAAVPVIIELIMIWAYKSNQIIDDKKEVWQSKDGVKDSVLQHDLLMVLIFDLLVSLQKVLKDEYEYFDTIVKELMMAMTRGFYIERQKLNINMSPLEEILKHWEKNYSQRNVNFNLVYDYAPLIGYWLATGDKGIFKRYSDFFKDRKRFSEVGQIINDIGDWNNLYDKGTRVYQDRFADIRNGIITYPVYMGINESLIKAALVNPEFVTMESWQEEIEPLRQSAIRSTKAMGKKCFADLTEFWQLNNRSGSHLINESYLLLKHNKYLK